MLRVQWSEIRAMTSPETLAAADRKREALEAALELRELARARGLTQEVLARFPDGTTYPISQFEA